MSIYAPTRFPTEQERPMKLRNWLILPCSLVLPLALLGACGDSGGGTDVLKSHGRETALGNQLLGGGQQL